MRTLLLFLLQLTFYSADAQQESPYLPKRGECGQLNEQYLYNLELTTAADEFPWIARLKFETANSPAATTAYKGLAVLVSRRHLLANARFFQDGQDYASISALLGAWNAADVRLSGIANDCNALGNCVPLTMEYDVEEVAVHPDFNKQDARILHNDIAVVRLRREVALGAYVQPICLPTSLALSNHVARFLPYVGRSQDARSGGGGKQLKVLGRVMNSQRCGRLKRLNITDGLMCAVSSEPALPLVRGSVLMDVSVEQGVPHHYYLIGLLSESGVGDELSTATPDVFVRVAWYIDWINYNMY